MAYNTKKGSQHSGDIQYEGDPNDTQIDFENDSIGLKTGGATRVLVTDTGLSGSAGMQTVGATILGSTLAVSGASTLNAVTAMAISGSGILQVAAAITSSGDIVGSGSVHATNFYGDGSTLTGVGSMDSIGLRGTDGSTQTITNGNTIFIEAGSGISTTAASGDKVTIAASGTVAQLTTGVETSGYLKVSGSSTLNAITATTISASSTLQTVGATTLGSTLNVSGVITAPSITGSMGLYSLTNGTLQVGHEEVGTGVAVKISTTTDSSVPMLVKSPSHQVLLGVTGSGKVLVGGMHLNAKLNISGSDPDQLISAAGTSRGTTFYVSASGETFVSGSVILQDVEPTIYFSGSNGSTILGQIGYNSSDNILIQNNVTNKHIVFKASDAGTIKEGLRLDGAVPEVVVNQNGASGENNTLVDFRVESDNNTHMLYVDGAADKIGINTDTPGTTLDINGSAIRLRSSSTPSSAGDLGMAGEIRWDANYIYICIATDTWRRIAHSTW